TKLEYEASQEPDLCVALQILRGLDGVRRMGNSLGNYIGVAEPPQEMMDKTMSIPDAIMQEWFELLTDRTAEEIRALADPSKGNPRDAKLTLGKDIVTFYYGTQAAQAAAEEWLKRFSRKEDATDISEFIVPASELAHGQILA